MVIGVFKKQGVFWINYHVNGRRKHERIGPNKRLAKTVLKKGKMEIYERTKFCVPLANQESEGDRRKMAIPGGSWRSKGSERRYR